SGQLTNLPAIVIIHGLHGSHNSMMDLGYFAAAYNYTCLLIDLPGHGRSGGPPPTQEWIIPDLSNYTGTITPEILNHTHFYLIARAAIRAVDVLLNQSFVDPTRIAMAGGSYGGLTTMFASNVYWQRVRSAIPVVASGNLDISFSTPWSLTNLVVDPHLYDISIPPYSDLIHYFDPLYYVNTTHNPATLFVCGTNDDFFPLVTFNNTFYATYNTTKAMAMSPGGHHGILMKPWEGTILYWLNYTMGNGPAPPNIQVSRHVEPTFFGHALKIVANITCSSPISRVYFAYHREVMGSPWETREMMQLNQTFWTFSLDNLPFNADVTYLIMVELNGSLYTMFSTSVWRTSLNTWFEIPFFILIALGFAFPIYLLIRRDLNRIQDDLSSKQQRKLTYLYGFQVGGMGLTELGIAFSLFLPLAIIIPQANALEVSMALFLSEFIDFLPLIAPLVFTTLLIGFFFAFCKPTLGGIINIILPSTLLILGIAIIFSLGDIADIASDFGLSGDLFSLGFGLFLWLLMGCLQIGFGIFKRKYQRRLQTATT
ncbi:MAG: alpha/beta hydrolase family protein, partial [Candidatus Helarchaeota archaeon]